MKLRDATHADTQRDRSEIEIVSDLSVFYQTKEVEQIYGDDI